MTAEILDRSNAYCILGAGAAGLTAAKNLLQQGIDVDVIERETRVGGQWNYGAAGSAIYNSIHLITSKRWIEFTDYPIPAHYPTYLGHRHAQQYLSDYADHFGVTPRIEFGRTVQWIDRAEGSAHWEVTLDGGEKRRYGGVVIANGHLWKPSQPTYPGTFYGTVLHSAKYRTPDLLDGKRVLVVGSGTSACDIVVEAGQHGEAAFMSIKRGAYYWPKYLFGLPIDTVYEAVLRTRLPLSLRRYFGQYFIKLNSSGQAENYGLPHPAHKLFEEHFVINSALLYALGHGDISVKPEISRLDGDQVIFVDGSSEKIDVIVYATGFHQAEFPFIDKKHLNWNGRTPALHMNCFHPTYDNLFLVGYFQTTTGNWQVMDYQAQAVARFVRLTRQDPQRAAWLRQEKAHPISAGKKLNNGIHYYDSERHWLQVEHFSYRGRLRKMVRRLPVEDLPAPLPLAAPGGPAGERRGFAGVVGHR
ncbi:MAG: NAD(P)-binding domain-containing protein [Frankiaceae bacterium]|jgi:cation diffusion facilitator CzcD-associated flavoprotein CzcO|nr:NAD(P)-binding domain-containing protein [Frankiaceae bacterium]